ncbi:Fibronectin type III domain protein [Paragonimus heterotremus]|uniref:Fibronectin type III domain protein n=1 Tax=Paragonimus heterotremus TaxID=100268 RepID=A0A8J4ST61_9TREM|nr:Fibronectin type III domain protein [Paragonimus heterotremus]
MPSVTGTPKLLSKGLIIPVNLVVRAVGASWARVGWELPEMPITYRSPSLVFQIKYYPIHLDQARADVTVRPSNEGSTGTGVVTIVNITVPWTAQLSKQSKLFKAMLRGLQPATQYEFGVCMMQQELEDRGRHNRMTNSGEPTELCWSMVQGFETVGQNPADPPRNIRVTFPKDVVAKRNFYAAKDSTASQNTEKSTQASAEMITVRLSWDPPRQTYGTIIAYLIYFTVDKHKMLNDWLERTALGEVRQTDLPEMRSSEVYFLRMAARNRHGASPFTPVIVFRTPDANGIGGGMVRLSKVYYDAREIEESLDQTDPDFRFESNSEAVDRASHTSEQQNNTTREQLQWIIVGCVLGGTVVIVLVAVTVLFHRCHYTGHSLGIVKR